MGYLPCTSATTPCLQAGRLPENNCFAIVSVSPPVRQAHYRRRVTYFLPYASVIVNWNLEFVSWNLLFGPDSYRDGI